MVRRPLIPVAVFTGVYLASFGAVVVARGNAEFLFYLAVMLALVGLIFIVDRRAALPAPLAWALSVWGLLHVAGGSVPAPAGLTDPEGQPVLYSMWIVRGALRYDHVVHAYGFGVATLVCEAAVRPLLARPGRVSAGLAVGVALMGLGLGAVNELVEFAATRILPETNVGGYENTGWDLVANTVGASAAAAALWARRRAGSRPANTKKRD
ncbi:MAG: hypothetical protein D6693_00115 [Planctomycetota bacterium]|nr:MAG: hypothetical protein D6693_00115 [Planctomycetota bacterium]